MSWDGINARQNSATVSVSRFDREMEQASSSSSTFISNEDIDWWCKVLSDEEEKEVAFREDWKKEITSEKSRFPALSEAEIEEWCRPFVPKNTQNNTGWAVCNFNEWQSAFNTGKSDDEKCPEFLLETCEDAGTLCRWLCRFVTSTRRSDGEQYTPTSIHSLLAGLYRYMKEKNPHSDEMNFMDKKDKKFKELHCVCDRLYRELRKKGIGLRTSNSS